MFKFVADNVGGAGTKRKQSPRSCEPCRRSHKRCCHATLPEQVSPSTSSPEVSGDGPSAPNAPHQRDNQSDASTQHAPSRLSASSPSVGPKPSGWASRSRLAAVANDAHVRFVANLSPESAFIINKDPPAGPSSISRHGVGLWLGQVEEEAPEEAVPANEQRTLNLSTQVLEGRSGQTLLLSMLRPALRRECIATIPPEHELGLLSELFFAKIDPIFPILRDEPWENHGVMETIALKQCICLVASLDPTMRSHLRLPYTDKVLSPVEFRARIAAAVKQSLDLGFVTNELVLLQVCTLMSMYVDDEGFGQLSTYYCSQAVLHEQTLGFHVGWPDGKAGGERSRRIFWCVYILDRLNAATNGRPTVIHQRDADKKVMDSVHYQEPAFKLLIFIAQLLDYTISLYRPQDQETARTKRTETFEDLVERAAAQNLNSGLLASLELFYLSALILQDRSSENQSSSEHQGFCAGRIVAVSSGEFKSSLIYWPILPYSVTVAASVAYRSMRKSPLSYNRQRAFQLFRDSCEVLDDLSEAFLSARAMARLAKHTMQEVGRATERTRRDSLRPPPPVPPESSRVSREATEVDKSDEEVRDSDQSQPLHVPGSPESPDADDTDPSFSAPYSHQNYLGVYDGSAEIFGNFDPNFDLSRTDAIFSASLDPSVPYFAEDWPALGNNTSGM